MSFSFGFRGDDIDEDQEEETDTLASDMSKHTLSGSEQPSVHTAMVLPKRHTLEELVSYNKLHVPAIATPATAEKITAFDPTVIYRRSLFDIRAQLMAEADPSSTHDGGEADSAETLLAGLENGDLSSGIYEGGFKTWECALDLVSLLVSSPSNSPLSTTGTESDDGSRANDEDENWEVIELGAGSAVPSLAILQRFLEQGRQTSKNEGQETAGGGRGSLKLTLCDYNEDVLRLATAPNILLNSLLSTTGSTHGVGLSEQGKQGHGNDDEGDLDLEEFPQRQGEDLIASTISRLQCASISLDFISGGWGPGFLELVAPSPSQDRSQPSSTQQHQQRPPTNLLVLASETIYSPSSIHVFSSTLVQLLRAHACRHGADGAGQGQRQGHAKAWVAAKKVYFGVGGGVDDFVREIERLGATSRGVFESHGTGVGRVVLEIQP